MRFGKHGSRLANRSVGTDALVDDVCVWLQCIQVSTICYDDDLVSLFDFDLGQTC